MKNDADQNQNFGQQDEPSASTGRSSTANSQTVPVAAGRAGLLFSRSKLGWLVPVLIIAYFTVILVLGYSIDNYTFVNSLVPLLWPGGLFITLLFSAFVTRNVLHRLIQQDGSKVSTAPLQIWVLAVLAAVLFLALAMAEALWLLSALVVIAVFGICSWGLHKKLKERAGNRSRFPLSTAKAVAFAILALVTSAVSVGVPFFIAAMFLSVRACELSGSSKCL